MARPSRNLLGGSARRVQGARRANSEAQGQVTRVLSISRAVDVAVDPDTAFAAFTDEIGAWYKTLPHAWNDPERAVEIRFDAGVGGRLIEVWDATTGEGYEMGKILVWEP